MTKLSMFAILLGFVFSGVLSGCSHVAGNYYENVVSREDISSHEQDANRAVASPQKAFCTSNQYGSDSTCPDSQSK